MTDAATTRKQVSANERKAGMQISYKPDGEDWVNEQYIGTSFTDTEWIKDENWSKTPDKQTINNLNEKISSAYERINLSNLNKNSYSLWNLRKYYKLMGDDDISIVSGGLLFQNGEYSFWKGNGAVTFIMRVREGDKILVNLKRSRNDKFPLYAFSTNNELSVDGITEYYDYNKKEFSGEITIPSGVNYLYLYGDGSYAVIDSCLSNIFIPSVNKYEVTPSYGCKKGILETMDSQSYLNITQGSIIAEGRMCLSGYIDTDDIIMLSFKTHLHSNVRFIEFYDEEKNPILFITAIVGKEYDEANLVEDTIYKKDFPEGAKYIRYSTYNIYSTENWQKDYYFDIYFQHKESLKYIYQWNKGDDFAEISKSGTSRDTTDGLLLNNSSEDIRVNVGVFRGNFFINNFSVLFDLKFTGEDGVFCYKLDNNNVIKLDKTSKVLTAGKSGSLDLSDLDFDSNLSFAINVKPGINICNVKIKDVKGNIVSSELTEYLTLYGYTINTINGNLVVIEKMSFLINNLDSIFSGDSISYGTGVTVKNGIVETYWGLLSKEYEINIAAYAVGGQQIGLINNFEFYRSIAILKPKNLVILFGTNGGTTIENLNILQTICRLIGINLIVNRIPNAANSESQIQQTDGNLSIIKEWIDKYAINKESAKFDLCTSKDGVYIAGNIIEELFADKLHPKNNGHILMRDTFIGDVPSVLLA